MICLVSENYPFTIGNYVTLIIYFALVINGTTTGIQYCWALRTPLVFRSKVKLIKLLGVMDLETPWDFSKSEERHYARQNMYCQRTVGLGATGIAWRPGRPM